jgi:hypothetical protein
MTAQNPASAKHSPTCFVASGDMDAQIADAVADGRLEPDDADALLTFRDFLRAVHDHGRAAVLADPQWAAYLREEA